MSSETLLDNKATTSTTTSQVPNVPQVHGYEVPYSSSEGHVDNASMVSTFSTNYTMSNVIGAGRTLGGLYSRAGRTFERYLALAAHKAGYGPQAVYNKLLVTKESRIRNETLIVKLCNKLFAYTRAEQASTRLLAIEKLIGFLEADFPILSVYLNCEGHNARLRLARIIQDMQAIPSARLSDLEQTLQRKSEELYMSLDVHCDGIILLSQSGTHLYREYEVSGYTLSIKLENQKMDRKSAFYGLLTKLMHPDSAVIALQYFASWLKQPQNSFASPPLLLLLCSAFKKVLRDDEVRDVLFTCDLNFIDVCATLHARLITDRHLSS